MRKFFFLLYGIFFMGFILPGNCQIMTVQCYDYNVMCFRFVGYQKVGAHL